MLEQKDTHLMDDGKKGVNLHEVREDYANEFEFNPNAPPDEEHELGVMWISGDNAMYCSESRGEVGYGDVEFVRTYLRTGMKGEQNA